MESKYDKRMNCIQGRIEYSFEYVQGNKAMYSHVPRKALDKDSTTSLELKRDDWKALAYSNTVRRFATKTSKFSTGTGSSRR